MRNLLLSNVKLKVLSLVFASALWFFVAGQSNTEVGLIVPMGLKGIPRDMVMTSRPPGEVEVRVMGPKFFISNLSPSQITAELDLSDAREGVNTYRLLPHDITTPMGVDVVRLRPGSVDIRLERLATVTLEVRPKITGRPAPGYRVAEVVVSPRTVTAGVLKKDSEGLGAVYTKPVDVSGFTFSKDVIVPLELPVVELRSMSADRAEVRISIKKER